MAKLSVLISGSSSKWWENLAAAFGDSHVFTVQGYVTSEELAETAARLYPDVVLWKPEGEDPLEVVSRLLADCPFTLPVMLVNDPREFNLLELIKAGIRGCLPLRLRPRQIVDTVELIANAGMLWLPRFEPELFEDNGKTDEKAVSNHLTRRERKILSLLAENLSNQEIGRALFLSKSTVKTHLRSIFRKLGVRNRTEALVAALRLGLLESKGLADVNSAFSAISTQDDGKN